MTTVIEIPAKPKAQKSQLKVAAYCRVSTNYPEQFGSLENQAAHFTKIICDTPNWKFAGVYAEHASGRNIENREEFARMIKDCDKGKINLIVTKSISRFGRNTLDTIKTLNKLEQQGIAVYFEIERLMSTDKKIKQVLTVLAAQAQAESEDKSSDIKWGIRRSMESGHVKLNHTQFLGYTRDSDGKLVVVPEEAETVKLIYNLYLGGYGCRKIKKHLESNAILTVTGKTEWSTSTVDRILSNEKYIGNALQQKTVVTNFFDGKQVKNTGQLDTIFIENSHEGIIDKETFEKVQMMKCG